MASHLDSKKKKRTVMRTFKINEVSAVDVPAQEGARAVIMKRAEPQDLEKRIVLTNSTKGHAHLVDDKGHDGATLEGGHTSHSTSTGKEFGHSHPWAFDQDGKVVIGEAEGHGHDVLETTEKRAISEDEQKKLAKEASDEVGQQEEPMTDKTQKNTGDVDVEAITAEKDKLAAQLVEANARGEMNDAQKAHFDGIDKALDDDKRAEFLKASPAERQAVIDEIAKRADEEDKVVFTAKDGTEYRKSDDPRLTAMAKQNDEQAETLKTATKRAEDADFTKRAETELNHLPGTIETRTALLKAAESIADEGERKSAVEALHAQNTAMGVAFENAGVQVTEEPTEDSAEGKLEVLAKKHAEDHKVTYEAAYAAVLETPEGGTLYAKSVDGQPVH